jgi:hypothetical protein
MAPFGTLGPMSFPTRLARAHVVDADIIEAPASIVVLTMRLLAQLDRHQVADLPIDFETGSLATNLRSATVCLKSVKSKGYAANRGGSKSRGPGGGVWHPWVLAWTWP